MYEKRSILPFTAPCSEKKRPHGPTVLAGLFLMAAAVLFLSSCVSTENPYPHWPALSEVQWRRMNMDTLQGILDSGASVHARSADGYTALMCAAQYCSDVSVLQLLLEKGANLDARSQGGETPLMMAVMNENPQVFEVLRLAGADITVRSRNGLSVLKLAVLAGSRPSVIVPLIQDGADNYLVDHGGFRRRELVEVFPQRRGEKAVWPQLTESLWEGMTVEELRGYLQKGQKTHSERTEGVSEAHPLYGATPLVYAAMFNTDPDVTEFLVSLETDTGSDLGGCGELFPLAAAVWLNRNPRVAGIILENGGDVNNNFHGRISPLMLAARNVEAPGMVPLLIDTGANVNQRSEYGSSALMHAAKAENLAAVEALLEAGAEINARDSKRWTAGISAAVHSGKPEVLQVLVDAGVSLDPRSETGLTTLMLASACNGNPEVIELLLAEGADIDQQSRFGYTALMFAAAEGRRSEVIQSLLEAGADPNLKNADQQTAWDLIQENEHLKGTTAYWNLRDQQLN